MISVKRVHATGVTVFLCLPSCQVIGSVKALQAAKYNLEKHYAVVGLASDLEMSLAVMESYLPRYFSGAVSIYSRLPKAEFGQEFRRNEAAVVVVANASSAVKAVGSAAHSSSVLIISKEAHEILSKNMSLEIDLYNFAQQRLLAQHRESFAALSMNCEKSPASTNINYLIRIIAQRICTFNLQHVW